MIDVWTLEQTKLLEFTDFINSHYPTIRFGLVHSESSLNALDLTQYLVNGFIKTDAMPSRPIAFYIYCKTVVILHIAKKGIPHGVALHIKKLFSRGRS